MAGSISLAALREMFVHNYWARDRQLAACAALTSEQFLRPLGNSFPSVRDTLVHLLAVECIWLERWRGRSPWRMMVHLLEHQTYHRGQVTALLRQLGVEPPKVDFLDAQDAGAHQLW
jgi:uncharacterized damage-inducible protein DinB